MSVVSLPVLIGVANTSTPRWKSGVWRFQAGRCAYTRWRAGRPLAVLLPRQTPGVDRGQRQHLVRQQAAKSAVKLQAQRLVRRQFRRLYKVRCLPLQLPGTDPITGASAPSSAALRAADQCG